MTTTMGARGELRSAPRVRQGDDQATFLSRWLRVWVILLTVVVLVVVVYLIIITNTLASINGNLTTAENDAANILAGLVSVNGHLNSICNSSLGGVAEGGNC